MSNLSIEKKKKLQALLGVISTDADKIETQKLDALKVKEITQFFNDTEAENESRIERLEKTLAQMIEGFDKYRKAANEHSKYLVETFGNFSENMVKTLEKVGGTITTSYEKNKPVNAAGVYKDMINQLAAIDKSVKEKPVPVWNWPQYAGVSVRNKNFANVNPSISPFGIEDFDDVQLSNYDINGNVGTVEYFLNGQGMGVLTLTYDGSGNLINAERTS
jgi:hypothetical protein